jgi:hypothetical protein
MPITHAPEPREIHLWCIFWRQIGKELRSRRHQNPRDDDDRRRELHFYFAHDRHRYVMTGAAVRPAGSRNANIPPEKLVFTSNKYSRPEILIDDSELVAPICLSTGRQRWRPLESWVLRRSYMRTRGGAFSIPLNNFSFYLAYPGQFWRFSLGSRHPVTARAEPAEFEQSPRLVLKEVVPLASQP